MSIKASLHRYSYPILQQLAKRKIRKAIQRPVCGERIRVGFLVQLPEVWNKQAPVFEAMLKDPGFDPRLVVVPEYDIVHASFHGYGDEYAFFESLYGSDHLVRALEADERWRDLRQDGFDYFFLSRNYEEYLPEHLATKNLIEYTRTCYIAYYYSTELNPAVYYEKTFFRNLFLFFCSSEDNYQRQKKRIRSIFLGYPSLDTDANPVLHEPHEGIRILWAPRWTEEEIWGGTTFYRFYRDILELKTKYPEIELVLRPHPLTFDHAVQTGKLTEEEIEAYKKLVEEKQVIFDPDKDVRASLRKTDILITDYSTLVVDYALTGKPLIHCTTPKTVLTDTYQKILDSSYRADSFQDVERFVDALFKGEDPLKEKRELLSEEMKKDHRGSAVRIARYIKNDAEKYRKIK